jgi:hypothetical protein
MPEEIGETLAGELFNWLVDGESYPGTLYKGDDVARVIERLLDGAPEAAVDFATALAKLLGKNILLSTYNDAPSSQVDICLGRRTTYSRPPAIECRQNS